MARKEVRDAYAQAKIDGYQGDFISWSSEEVFRLRKLERQHNRLLTATLDFFKQMDMSLGYEDGNGNSLDPIVRRVAKLIGYSLKDS